MKLVRRGHRLGELLLRLRDLLVHPAELGLHGLEQLHDLDTLLRERDAAEAGLQGIEDRRDCRRSRDEDPEILAFFGETLDPEDLRVQPLRRKEHDRVVRRARRVQIFVSDGPGLIQHAVLQSRNGRIHCLLIPSGRRVHDMVVEIGRELRVDRKIDCVPRPVLGRKFHGKFNPVGGVFLRRDILIVLGARQRLLENPAQLHLAPGAPRLHIGQCPVEVRHTLRKRLQLAERMVQPPELVPDRLEIRVEPLI